MSTSTLSWSERSFELDSRINWPVRFRLESESSPSNTDDTESVYSVQGKETERVRDTSDTDSDSTVYDVDIEYEIGSLSEDERDLSFIFRSSGESDSEDIIFAAAVAADSSLETFITDAEDSDNSRQDDSSTGLRDFWICIQCKSQNDNPQFRFCDKCFQDRKAIFPPRPRRRKKAEKTSEKPHFPVKTELIKSCLTGHSSQDSGIGSSQESDPLIFNMRIMVPASVEAPSCSKSNPSKCRKRQISESSLSDECEEASRPRKQARISSKTDETEKKEVVNGKGCEVISETARTNDDQVKGPLPELKEDCIMCNVKPKNSVFLHGRIAHMCCCYGCAMRTWKSLKRCPICKRKVSNVVRVFTT